MTVFGLLVLCSLRVFDGRKYIEDLVFYQVLLPVSYKRSIFVYRRLPRVGTLGYRCPQPFGRDVGARGLSVSDEGLTPSCPCVPRRGDDE